MRKKGKKERELMDTDHSVVIAGRRGVESGERVYRGEKRY